MKVIIKLYTKNMLKINSLISLAMNFKKIKISKKKKTRKKKC